MPGVSFAGIYDKNPARAAEVAKQLDTVAHPALGALLECVEAVTLAVPPPARAATRDAASGAGHALPPGRTLAGTLRGGAAPGAGAPARGAGPPGGHEASPYRAV